MGGGNKIDSTENGLSVILAGLILRLLKYWRGFIFICLWGIWFDIMWDDVGYCVKDIKFSMFCDLSCASFLIYSRVGILFVVFLEEGMFRNSIPERCDNCKKK